MASTSSPTDPVLQVQRLLWLAIASTGPLFGVLALLLGDREPAVPVALPVALVAAIAVAMVVAVVAVERLLVASPPPSDGAALAAYRARFFVQAALSEVPVLLAFVMTIALGPPWLGLVGAAGSLLAALAFRPSRARMARIDRGWQAHGHDVSMLRLLDRTAR